MITKHIATPNGGSGFKRLAGYVLNARAEHRDATDPASWTRLGAYILDTQHDGEKVAWARATNCGNDDPGWASKAILSTQERNTRSKSDKSYHLVISFPEGERPTREQIEDIEDRLCEAIGFGEHQRVSAVHQNTDNWHLHVAVNKVHPTTFRNVTPHRDHYRLQEACAELEIRHGLTQEPHTVDVEQGRERKARGKAADFEARHGGQSFLTWTQEHAGAGLVAARDAGEGWQAVHQAAATYGLTVKLRGAGLVIGHQGDSRLHAKASDVDRGLSLKAMTEHLGPFELAGQEAGARQPQATYQKPQRSGDLYEAFQRERAAKLTAQHRAYARELADWYKQRVRHERAQKVRGPLRRDGFQHIAEQREQDRTARLVRERDERHRVRAEHGIPHWQSWLETQAAGGNEAALASLRSRQRRTQQLADKVLTATDADQARHIVHQHMRPAIRRGGRVIYRTEDGGLVFDEARQVRVSLTTTAAAFLALSLASERFGPRPLVVNGSDEFRNQVARVAGIEGVGVTFADPVLERQRGQARAEHAENVANTVGRGSGSPPKRGQSHEGGHGR